MAQFEQQPRSIVLISKNKDKLGATLDGYAAVFGEQPKDVQTYDVDTDIKQPEGIQTLHMAQQRLDRGLEWYRDMFQGDPDLMVVIESGLFNEYVRMPRRVVRVEVDRALVLMHGLNKQVITISEAVRFPKKAVAATRALPGGFRVNTVGKTMAEWYGWDHVNWQSVMSKGRLTRRLQMARAVEDGLRGMYDLES